jgi:hypothetical protein
MSLEWRAPLWWQENKRSEPLRSEQRSVRALEVRMLQRLRDATSDREPIYWLDGDRNDFEPFLADSYKFRSRPAAVPQSAMLRCFPGP